MCPPPRPGNFIHDRWHVLQLVKDTARALGIGEREIAVLSAHLSVLPKGPARSDHLLISFAQVTGILERANCMDERRFRRGETRLEEVGLIARKLSGNARRFPVRNGRGQIVDAYGIDLRPLFLRVPELESLRDALAEDEACRRARRSHLSARLGALRRQVEAGTLILDPQQAETIATLARLCRRSQVGVDEFDCAERQLDEISTEPVQSTSSEPPARLPDTTAGDAGQTVRLNESSRKEIQSPLMLWAKCPKMAGYFPDPPRTVSELARRAMDFLRFLGLTETAMNDLTERVEIPDLLVMLEYVTDRLGHIGNPAGYLRSMAARYSEGETVAGGSVRLRRSSYDRGHPAPVRTAVARAL